MDYEVGQLIDYRFIRTGGVFSGRIQYIDEEKIKLSGPPPSGKDRAEQYHIYKRKKKYRGSWYWLDELEILSD